MDKVYDTDCKLIAWIDSSADCKNPWCKRAIRQGLPVHIIPAHTDPRAEEFTLAMPTYHFATEEDALAALEEAWNTAEVANTADERDDAYSRSVPVKIAKGVRRP